MRFYGCLMVALLLAHFAQGQGELVISHDLRLDDTTQVHYLHTTRGDVFVGRLLDFRQDSLEFRLRRVPRPLVFHFREVTYVGPDRRPRRGEEKEEEGESPARERSGRYQPSGPPVHRLFYSATGFPMEGDGEYRNAMILFNETTVKVNDHFSVSGGALFPVVFVARATGRTSISETFHLGLSAHFYMPIIDPEFSVLHPYLHLTIGRPEGYMNFSYGPWLDLSAFPSHAQLLGIGGAYSMSDRWRFFGEAMLVWDEFDVYFVPTALFGHSWRRNSIEFGLAGLPESDILLFPVVGYSLRW